jgi:hypothetical protein
LILRKNGFSPETLGSVAFWRFFAKNKNAVQSNHQPRIVTVTLPTHQNNFILQTAQFFNFLKEFSMHKILYFSA